MDATTFTVELLAKWIVTGQDFETLLAEALAATGIDAHQEASLRDAARQDWVHLKAANLDKLRHLKGNPSKLRQEIAGILRW